MGRDETARVFTNPSMKFLHVCLPCISHESATGGTILLVQSNIRPLPFNRRLMKAQEALRKTVLFLSLRGIRSVPLPPTQTRPLTRNFMTVVTKIVDIWKAL
jgi:hypothetical protein